MRIKTKIVIVIAAAMITLAGFNMICSSGFFCSFFKSGVESLYAYLPPAYKAIPDAVVTASLKP